MRSRLLLNLALAMLATVLAVYLFWVPQAPAVEPPLPGLDTTQVTTLSISTIGGSVELMRDDSGWRITAPYLAAANPRAVNRILSRLPPPVHRRYAAEELDLAATGLSPAQITVTLDSDTTLAFGSRAPLEGYRYLLVDGTIYLAEDSVYYLMSGGASLLVDRHLVPEGAVIDRIELPIITLTRGEAGWQREPDDGATSDADQTLVDRWSSSQAISVIVLPDQLPEDLQRIVIITADGAVRALWSDPAEDGLHLYDLDGGAVYEMPGGLRGALLGLDREPATAGDDEADDALVDPGSGPGAG